MLHGRTVSLFGLPVDALDMEAVLEVCGASLAGRQRLMIGVVNAAKVVSARRDSELQASLLECDVLLADGQSVVWASRLLGSPLPERVAGIDIFERLLAKAAKDGAGVYLLGARPNVVQRLRTQLELDYPGLVVAGARDGYFSAEEAEEVASDIRRSGADMLFLGMVSPKKENFLRAWGPTLGVSVLHGVGGSFDVLAGVTKRAPEAWQRAGLEWLYRLLQEPRRMWKRYLTTNAAFCALTIREIARPTPPMLPDRQGLRVIDLRDRTLDASETSGSLCSGDQAARGITDDLVIDLRDTAPVTLTEF